MNRLTVCRMKDHQTIVSARGHRMSQSDSSKTKSRRPLEEMHANTEKIVMNVEIVLHMETRVPNTTK